MGEIADMHLDGTVCESCGEFLPGPAPGFPRYCAGCRPSIERPALKKAADGVGPLSSKDIKWLKAAARPAGSGLYPGERWEFATARFDKLYKRGLVSYFEPHNSVHKLRAVITEKGRTALARAKADAKLAELKGTTT